MPLYEYECDNCHAQFERFQNFDAPPVTECEHCSGKVRRLISRPAILFKGSGFHVTDYRSGGAPRSSPDSVKGNGQAQDGKAGEASKSSKPEKPAPPPKD